MKKIRLILLLFFVLFLIIIFYLLLNSGQLYPTGHIIKENHVHTQAICNKSNFCQDYMIYCNKDELVKKIPIEGAIVRHSENWTDPSKKNNRENLCP